MISKILILQKNYYSTLSSSFFEFMVYLWKQLTLSNDILKYFVKFNFFRFIKEDAILSNKSEKKNKDEYNTAKFNIDINSSFAEDLNQSPLKSNDLTEKNRESRI